MMRTSATLPTEAGSGRPKAWPVARLLPYWLGVLLSFPVLGAGWPPTPGGASTDPAPAAAAATLPEAFAPEDVDRLVAPLSEREARQWLIDRLKNDATQVPDGGDVAMHGAVGFIQGFQDTTMMLSERAEELLAAVRALPDTWQSMFRNLTDAEGWPAMWRAIGVFLLLVAAGLLAERLLSRTLAPLRAKLNGTVVDRWLVRVGCLLARVLLDVTSILAFALVGAGLSFVFYARFDPMRWFILTYFLVIVITWGVSIGSRFLFAPSAAGLRLLPLSDAQAQALYRWTLAIALLGSFGVLTAAMLVVLGLPPVLFNLLVVITGFGVLLILIALVWSYRELVAERLAGDPRSSTPIARGLRASLNQSWHVFATLYLVLVWVMWAPNRILGRLDQANAAVFSLSLFVAIPFVDRLVASMLDRLTRFQLGEDPSDTEMERERQFRQMLRVSVRLVIVLVALLALAEAWGVGILALLATPTGSAVGHAVVNISITLLLGYLVWGVLRGAIDRHLPKDEERALQELGGEGGGAGGTRAETLLPLLRSFLFAVLVVIATLVVLSSVGVDIGPLLAGASIVGLAIGFGSQKLVQDIVAGIFFLIDDAFRVGEYIEAGNMKGVVESISVRSMRLRHHLGAVQTLPYGEIQAVRNHSRDWVIMKLEIRVPYDTDIEKVRKTIKKTGQQMLEDPVIGPNFLQPLKSQGVFRVEESALIIRMKFTAVPGEQWVIRREAYRRVRDALAAAGISFAHREVTVRLPESVPESEREHLAKSAGAAAAGALAADQAANRNVGPGSDESP
jgi:small-conductance mechanosensitive channel